MDGTSVNQNEQIARLQKNLSALRRIAGWTMEELGKRIGVTKQTISNLENHRGSDMTLTQYLAIRFVLDKEAMQRIATDENDKLLFQAICKVLDENLPEDEQEDAEENVALLASAVAGKTSQAKVQELADEKIPLSGFAIATAATMAAAIAGAGMTMPLGGIIPLLATIFGAMNKQGNSSTKTGIRKKK